MEDTSRYYFMASWAQTKNLQENILRKSPIFCTSSTFQRALDSYIQICGSLPSSFSTVDTASHLMRTLAVPYFDAVKKEMPTKYSMIVRDLVLWHCNKLKHAQDYLMTVPISGLNQNTGPRQFASVLCYRLGIPLFEEGSVCSCCKGGMDIYGDHAIHCAKDIGVKFRHDLVRDTLADACFRAGVPARKEVALGLLADDGSALRPADLMVYNWENGQDICFDVTVVSPLAGGGVSKFIPGRVISDAVSLKQKKYLDKCSTQGYGLGVLAFTTLGELGGDMVVFLKRLRSFIASHDFNERVSNFVIHKIEVVIQKGIGAQFVAQLQSNSLVTEDV